MNLLRVGFVLVLGAVIALVLSVPARASEPVPADDCRSGDDACAYDLEGPLDPPAALAEGAAKKTTLSFFWGVGCPHCEEARLFIDDLEKSDRDLSVERWEVRRDPEGRRRFIETMKRLGVEAAGIPTFVVGQRYVVGFQKGSTEAKVP